MTRLCARPGCSAPATATFTFDGLRRIVWLAPLAEAAAYSAGDLCRRHAELLKAPRSWELRDLRPTPGHVAPAGAPAPSRHAAPSSTAVPAVPFERPATRSAPPPAARAPRPLPGARGEQPALPTATSPLLSRAFRNAG